MHPREKLFFLSAFVFLAFFSCSKTSTKPAAPEPKSVAAPLENSLDLEDKTTQRNSEPPNTVTHESAISEAVSEGYSSSSAASAKAESDVVEEVEQAQVPVAFFEPPDVDNWSGDQLQRLNTLRLEFAGAMGGWNQNPYDPAYEESWKKAQPIFDEKFQALFGTEAFNAQQIRAIHGTQ